MVVHDVQCSLSIEAAQGCQCIHTAMSHTCCHVPFRCQLMSFARVDVDPREQCQSGAIACTIHLAHYVEAGKILFCPGLPSSRPGMYNYALHHSCIVHASCSGGLIVCRDCTMQQAVMFAAGIDSDRRTEPGQTLVAWNASSPWSSL